MNTGSGPPLNVSTLRVIVIAMMVGVLIFSVVAAVIASRGAGQPDLAVVLLPIIGGLGVMELLGYFFVRRGVLAKLLESIPDEASLTDAEEEVLPALATLTIIGAAMAEGFGLFGGVVLLVTGNWAALAAPAIALLILVLRIPTQDRVSVFVDAIQQSR